ncbi:MAG: hypothetical protein MUE97_05115, partial [Phycisphaerales bacterium]|nr:hypothetical protein [Phycisphaerales bacterium]
MSRMMRPLLTAAVLVTLATAPVGVLAQGSAPGSADTGGMKVAEPYVVIVTAGEVPIRCGDSTFHYPIAQAKAGEALVVDGETSNWLRVKYPASIEPLVPVAEATEPVNNVIRLRVPSKLLAPNATGG